jgi:hypothetical protein
MVFSLVGWWLHLMMIFDRVVSVLVGIWVWLCSMAWCVYTGFA